MPIANITTKQMIRLCAVSVDGKVTETLWEQLALVEGLALMVTVKGPRESELLDQWKATWDGLIWKAMIRDL
jgi:hypothetical protein